MKLRPHRIQDMRYIQLLGRPGRKPMTCNVPHMTHGIQDKRFYHVYRNQIGFITHTISHIKSQQLFKVESRGSFNLN